jgi:hypothetical protein
MPPEWKEKYAELNRYAAAVFGVPAALLGLYFICTAPGISDGATDAQSLGPILLGGFLLLCGGAWIWDTLKKLGWIGRRK